MWSSARLLALFVCTLSIQAALILASQERSVNANGVVISTAAAGPVVLNTTCDPGVLAINESNVSVTRFAGILNANIYGCINPPAGSFAEAIYNVEFTLTDITFFLVDVHLSSLELASARLILRQDGTDLVNFNVTADTKNIRQVVIATPGQYKLEGVTEARFGPPLVSGTSTLNFTVSVIPEPSTIKLTTFAFVGIITLAGARKASVGRKSS